MKKNMPQRTIHHQNESQSILAFEKLLPQEWVYRGKDKDDYGIDGEVEIFTQDGSATGQIFYVQLKSTNKNLNLKGEITYYLKESTLNYYSEIDTPILLVYYLKKKDIFYARWVNNIRETINYEKEKYPIKFTSVDIISIDFFIRIAKKSKIYNVLQFASVEINTDGTAESNKLKKVLESWLEITFLQTIEIGNMDNEQKIVLDITKNKNSLEVSIQDLFHSINSKDKLQFDDNSNYLWYPNFSLEHFDIEFRNLFLKITLSVLPLLGNTHNEFLARLLILLEDDEDVSDIIAILLPLMRAKEYKYIKNVLEGWIKDSKYILVQYFSLAILKINSRLGEWHELHKLHESMILMTIQNTDWHELRGVLYFNLANATRYRNPKKALEYYKLAKKNKINYSESEYWNKEVAGTLFVLRRYYCSLKFYEVGLSVGNEDSNKDFYLLSFDSAYMARKFKLAKKYLALVESCYTREDSIPSEFVLKATILKWLEGEGYISDDFVYQYEKAKNIVKHIDSAKVSQKNMFNSGMKYDPLHPLINFNFGMYKSEEKDEMAYIHFLITALHEYYDYEAWGYAIVESITSIKPDEWKAKYDSCNTLSIFPIILNAYSTKYGNSGLLEFKKFLDNNILTIDIEIKKVLYNIVSKSLTESKAREEGKEEDKMIRFLRNEI